MWYLEICNMFQNWMFYWVVPWTSVSNSSVLQQIDFYLFNTQKV